MINEHVFLESSRLRLVPYLSCFTPRYHQWMCEPELLALTESEPLSLEEELENQQSWLYAEDKLTFILLAPLLSDSDKRPTSSVPYPVASSSTASSRAADAADHPRAFPSVWVRPGELEGADDPHAPPRRFTPSSIRHAWSGAEVLLSPASASASPPVLEGGAVDRLERSSCPCASTLEERAQRLLPLEQAASPIPALVMIGDCNLFLLPNSDDDEDDDHDRQGDGQQPVSDNHRDQAAAALVKKRVFEVEVMVAEESFRRRGLAKEAIRLLMCYAVEVLGATGFVAKILDSNEASIRLFQEVLGFTVIKRVPVFHEVHLAREVVVVPHQKDLNTQEQQRAAWRAELQAALGNEVVVGPYTKQRHEHIPVMALSPSDE